MHHHSLSLPYSSQHVALGSNLELHVRVDNSRKIEGSRNQQTRYKINIHVGKRIC